MAPAPQYVTQRGLSETMVVNEFYNEQKKMIFRIEAFLKDHYVD